MATGTIYTTHSTPIKSIFKPVALLRDFVNSSTEYCDDALKPSEELFHKFFNMCSITCRVLRHTPFFICLPFILLFLKLFLSFIFPEELKK